MARLLSIAFVTVLIVAAVLLAFWLFGKLLIFIGMLLANLVWVISKLLWFFLLTTIFAGLAYFLASGYRRQ